MQKSIKKRWLLNSFWLSLLLHLLILLSITFVYVYKPTAEEQRSASKYVPSYVYTGAVAPSAHQTAKQSSQSKTEQKQVAKEEHQNKENLPVKKNGLQRRSILSSTLDMLKSQQQQAITAQTESEPIYLLGDQTASDPLILLLGKALSANFRYPQQAGELGYRGRVLVGMTLHPEGYFTNVQIVKSSENGDLDAAALYAVNQAPTVVGADRFISQPKHFVICFIFN